MGILSIGYIHEYDVKVYLFKFPKDQRDIELKQ